MSKSTIVGVIIVAILAIGGVLALTHKSSNINNSTTSTNTTSQTNGTSSSATNQASATGAIDIKNMMFKPPQITVAKGGTVTWTNNDSVAHTVTDDLTNVGGPASGNIAPGSTYSFTFTKAGSFQYHCTIHPSMRGTIVVK